MNFALLKRILLIGLLFLTPLVLYYGNSNYDVTKTVFVLLALGVMAVVWALELAMSPQARFHKTPLLPAFLAMAFAMALSLFNSENVRLSLESAIVFVYFFFLFLYVANAVERRSDVGWVVGSLIASTTLTAILGLLQYFGVFPGHPDPRTQAELMISTMGNKNYLGGVLAYMVWPGLGMLWAVRHWMLKAAIALGLLAIGGALFLIDSDSVWLALGGSAMFVVAIAVFSKVRRPNRAVTVALLAMGALMSCVQLGPDAWSAATLAQPDQADGVLPLIGNWEGKGTTPGLYRPEDGMVALRTQGGGREIDLDVSGGVPLAGDWLGEGGDQIGIFREGVFYLIAGSDRQIDLSFQYGLADDRPLAGDWNGDGLTDWGLYRPSEKTFLLLNEMDDADPRRVAAPYAQEGDWPVAGAGNGASADGVGLYRPSEGLYLWDWNLDGEVDGQVQFGEAIQEDLPVVQRADGSMRLGLFRPVERLFLWDDNADGRVDRKETWQPSGALGFFSFLLKPSLLIRLQDWLIAWEMFKDYSWFGVGLGNYRLEFLPYKAQVLQGAWGRALEAVEANPEVGFIPRSEHAHNEYFNLAAEMGIVGVLAFAFALALVVRTGWRLLRSTRAKASRWLIVSLLAGLLAVLLDGMFSFPFYLVTSAVILTVWLGLLNSRYALGDGATVRLGRWSGWGVFGGVLALAVLGGTFAARNYAADLRLNEGRALLLANQARPGEAKLLESAQLDFAPTEVLSFLGFYYERTRQYDACIDFNERALRAHVNEFDYLYLGECHLALGNDEKAFGYFNQLMSFDPRREFDQEVSRTFENLYQLALDQRRSNPPLALRWMEGMASVCSQDLEWQGCTTVDVQRARWYVEGGSPEGTAEAMKVLNGVVAEKPSYIPAYLELARLDAPKAEGYLMKSSEMIRRHLRLIHARMEQNRLSAQALEALRKEEAQWLSWESAVERVSNE